MLLNAVDEDIKRLKSSNLSLIKFEEEKSIGEICRKLSQFALIKATEKINKKMNYSLQKKFVMQSIEKLSTKTLS